MIPTSTFSRRSPCAEPRRVLAALAFAASLAALAAFAPTAMAQDAPVSLSRGDTLIKAGRLAEAEALYYDAVKQAPRDPGARLALGWYLASRGSLRSAAVLMEEARYFGGNPTMVAQHLAPVYAQMGDYTALAALPGSSQVEPVRSRSGFLRENPGGMLGPDSAEVVWVVSDSAPLGHVVMRIGRDTIHAAVSATVQGLVLDTAWAKRVRRFTTRGQSDPTKVLGVVPRIELGAVAMTNVPTTFQVMGGRGSAVIGLEMLGRLSPTFDPAAQRMVVRRRAVETPLTGEQISTLSFSNGIWLVRRNGTLPLASSDGARLLENRRWTFVASRGLIVATP